MPVPISAARSHGCTMPSDDSYTRRWLGLKTFAMHSSPHLRKAAQQFALSSPGYWAVQAGGHAALICSIRWNEL